MRGTKCFDLSDPGQNFKISVGLRFKIRGVEANFSGVGVFSGGIFSGGVRYLDRDYKTDKYLSK